MRLVVLIAIALVFGLAGTAEAVRAPNGTPVHPFASKTLRVPAHGYRWWATPPVDQAADVAFDVWINGRAQPNTYSDTAPAGRACSADHPACHGRFAYGTTQLVMYGTYATAPARFSVGNHSSRALTVRVLLYSS